MRILIIQGATSLEYPSGELSVISSEKSQLKKRHTVQVDLIKAKTYSGALLILSVFNILWSWRNYRKVVRSIEEFKPDIIHFHTITPYLSMSTLMAAKKNKIPVVKKNIKTKKLSSNLVKTSSEIKALKNKLLLVTAQLKTAKKSDAEKGVKIKKLQSESKKLSMNIKALENNLSLTKTELEGLKKTDTKKSEELKKLNENVNYLLESIDDQKAELAKLSIYSGVSEKYKEIIKCYRSALVAWNNLISRQGLTEKEFLVVGVELRRSLFACPPI